jgi:hypothetical protein
MRIAAIFTVILLPWVLATPVVAHEFWIEPTDYTIGPDDIVTAFVRNGQDFGGVEIAYFPQRFVTYSLILGEQAADVTSRLGDNPSLAQASLGDGLHIAAYQSSGDIVTYESYAPFARFIEHKDFPGHINRQHHERELPDADFSEFYTRYCKSLIAVGSGAGADRVLGFETELVALANPYTDDLTAGLPVLALYQGEPRPETQVELFEKAADGTVLVTYYQTNADGVALLPVRSGYSYMADAVVLRIPVPSITITTGSVWESLWANLTFAVP